MNKNKLIIGIIVILVVLASIFLLGKSKKEMTESILPGENMETISENGNEENQTIAKVIEDEKAIEAKFSSLLASGTKSFNEKDLDNAIKYFNQALLLKDSDLAYIRLYYVYNLKGDLEKSRIMIEKAIAKNPSYTDYWITKIIFLNEKSNNSFDDLKSVYYEGLSKADSRTKVNLVTFFAGLSAQKGEKVFAISLWEKAIELNPDGKNIYQAEIDLLK